MLTRLLIHWFVRNADHPDRPTVRLSFGLLTGYVGIGVNLLLFLLKFGIGLFSGSVAIAADAVNNLSDAGSAVITVCGFKFSSRPADQEHPFGHGRLEYVAGVIVSVIIIAVGLDFLKESVIRIFRPGAINADAMVLGIVAGTLLFKVWLFFFYRNIGRRIDSKVIRAAAFDSLSDLLGTFVVLAAVFASRRTTFPIDGCAGSAVAVLVIWGGVRILRDTVNPLLGECPDPHLVEELKTRLLHCRGIRGVHDIILHNYGPNLYFATAHAEVNRDGNLLSVHDMLEAAEVEIARTMPIRLLLHCDPYDTADPKVRLWRAQTENAVTALDRKFKLYDFRLDETGPVRILHFHLLTPRNYSVPEPEIRRLLTERMREYDPSIELKIDFINAYV